MAHYTSTIASLRSLSLEAAGIIALADLSTVQFRTILRPPSWLDIFTLCPGLHQQQDAPNLSKSEYPATAALTTGYVFRIENEAMVTWLQHVSAPARVTTISITNSAAQKTTQPKTTFRTSLLLQWISRSLYLTAILSTLTAFTLLIFIFEDYISLSALLTLTLSRLINTTLIRRRLTPSWHGALEPGVKGDLLVLLSQDRWIRLQGYVDPIKTVTSGQWLRDLTPIESVFEAVGRVLVYACAAVIAPNASQMGSLVLIVVLLGEAVLLGAANMIDLKELRMHGVECRVVGCSGVYKRRRDLADQLIMETGRDDWAKRLGMVNQDNGKGEKVEKVTM